MLATLVIGVVLGIAIMVALLRLTMTNNPLGYFIAVGIIVILSCWIVSLVPWFVLSGLGIK